MRTDTQDLSKIINFRRIGGPVFLGLGLLVFLFSRDSHFSWANLRLINQADWRYLLLLFVAVGIRDLGYLYRIRVLTGDKVSWLSGFYVIAAWEFISAITPFGVGGGVTAVFLLLREGVSLGRALACIIMPTLLDNIFFLGVAPLSFWGCYASITTHVSTWGSNLGTSIELLFWMSYCGMLAYTLLLAVGLFLRPQFLYWSLRSITSNTLLQRWRRVVYDYGDDIIKAATCLNGESFSFWRKVVSVSFLIWSLRYLVLNVTIAAYLPLSWTAHLLILSKQFIMWSIMLVSPTPGGSGAVEFFYKQLHQDLLGDYTLVTLLIWRLFTYYIYLILGIVSLPRLYRYIRR